MTVPRIPSPARRETRIAPPIYRDGYRRHFRPDEAGPFKAIYRTKLDLVLASLMQTDPCHILDVGGGYGRLSAPLGTRHRVVLLDISPEMLGEARGRCAGDVALVEGDARRLPFPDETFDVVIALDLLVHLPGLSGGLSELARVLRPGGQLMTDTTNASPWWVAAYPAYVGWRPIRLVRTMRAGGVLPEWTRVVRHQRAKEVGPAMAAAGLELEGMTPIGPPWCAKWHLWKAARVSGPGRSIPGRIG